MNLSDIINSLSDLSVKDIGEIATDVKQVLLQGTAQQITTTTYSANKSINEIPLFSQLKQNIEFKQGKSLDYLYGAPDQEQINSLAIHLTSKEKGPEGKIYWARGTRQVYVRLENLAEHQEVPAKEMIKKYNSRRANTVQLGRDLLKRPKLLKSHGDEYI